MTYLRPHVYGNFKPPREQRKRAKSPAEKRDGKDPEYLAMVRQLPCCIQDGKCGGHMEAHHLKSAGGRGMAQKAEDRWTLPLCYHHHQYGVERVGSSKEVGWFKERGIDCLSLASALYQNRHSLEAMNRVLRAHVEGK